MKPIYIALFMGLVSHPVLAKAPSKVPSLFPDAPPPPQIAEAPPLYCCNVSERLILANPESAKGKSVAEGAACEMKTADGFFQTGTVCY